MKNKNILWGLAFVVLVVILGLIVFGDRGEKVTPITTNNNVVNENTNSNQPQGAEPSTPSNLSTDEKAALEASSGGSDVGVDTQMALAEKAAKEVDVINVTGCELSPAVLKVKYQKNFTLKNTGTDEVVIIFYVDNVTRTVAGGGEKVVTADFGKSGGGLFGYYCRSGSVVHDGLMLMYNL